MMSTVHDVDLKCIKSNTIKTKMVKGAFHSGQNKWFYCSFSSLNTNPHIHWAHNLQYPAVDYHGHESQEG